MMRVLVRHLTPETRLRTQHILLILIICDLFLQAPTVKLHPGDKAPVADTVVVADTHVEVVGSVVADYDFFVGVGQAAAPPVDDVAVVDLDLGVHPVHGGF